MAILGQNGNLFGQKWVKKWSIFFAELLLSNYRKGHKYSLKMTNDQNPMSWVGEMGQNYIFWVKTDKFG